MSNYNENFKNLYKDMIRKGCLIVVDKFEKEFRGTGKTTALKELQEEGYFVLGRNFDNLNSLRVKIQGLSKSVDIKTIKVLVDEDYEIQNMRGTCINVNGVKARVEIIGGFINEETLNINSRYTLNKETEVITLNDYIIHKLYESMIQLESFRDSYLMVVSNM